MRIDALSSAEKICIIVMMRLDSSGAAYLLMLRWSLAASGL